MRSPSLSAQIVSGIGFIGGGVIFVRKDIGRGLTTASIVWLTAAVGMAAGAGLPVLAAAVTFGHFVVVFLFPAIERHLPKSRWAPTSLHVSYQERRGALREILAACTGQEFSVSQVQIERQPSSRPNWEDHSRETEEAPLPDLPRQGIVTLMIEARGAKSVPEFSARLSEIGGVTSVRIGDGEPGFD